MNEIKHVENMKLDADEKFSSPLRLWSHRHDRILNITIYYLLDNIFHMTILIGNKEGAQRSRKTKKGKKWERCFIKGRLSLNKMKVQHYDFIDDQIIPGFQQNSW